jgi:CRISP-associated protein Cas1
MRDLHELPKLRDSLSYLYIEHAVLNRRRYAIEAMDKTHGRTLIPVAALSVLLLGPGTSITHEAIKVLADNGCLVIWAGEDATRFYAQGMGETRRANHLLHQAALASDMASRLRVVERMYRMRFREELPPDLTLPQIRGREGVRVRESYARASREYGVPWHGRRYDRGNWSKADPVNRALSAANALLNGLCQTAIISGGYSPAIGFIHTGKQLSFVYDIADLYKTEFTVPLAFAVVAESPDKVEARVRQRCRERFHEARLLQRILPDIDALLEVEGKVEEAIGDVDEDGALPEALWAPLRGDGQGTETTQ